MQYNFDFCFVILLQDIPTLPIDKALSSSTKRSIIRATIPQGIFCLSSALYIHYPTKNVKGEIKEKTRPHKHELAVPRGHVHSKISNIKNVKNINLHYVKPEHHEIGKTISEDRLPCYDLERTICDYFKKSLPLQLQMAQRNRTKL